MSRKTLTALGQTLTLRTGPARFLQEDSLWRLGAIYEPFLAASSLRQKGRALDIGAGFGAFSLPFARAFPGWEVFAFEPDPAAYALLCENSATAGLDNITAFNVAIGPPRAGMLAAMAPLTQALERRDPQALRAAAPDARYMRHQDKRGYLAPAPPPDRAPPEFDICDLPEVPADALRVLAPTLMKFTAPRQEAALLAALADAPLAHIVGESWQDLEAARLLAAYPSVARLYVPRAGSALRIHMEQDFSPLKHGLDVICAPPDTAADLWERGRAEAAQRHIAFVTTPLHPDLPPPATLLELARQSGAECVLARGPARPPEGVLHGRAYCSASGADLARDGGLPGPEIVPSLFRRDFIDNRNIHFSPHLGPECARLFLLQCFMEGARVFWFCQ